MIKLLFRLNKLEDFKELLKVINKPQLIAKVLLMYPREIAKREKLDVELSKEVLEFILESVKKKKISESDIKHVLEKIVKGSSMEDAIKIEKVDLKDIEHKIMKMIKDKPGLNANAYMGLVMKEFKGKVSGSEVMQIIKKYVK